RCVGVEAAHDERAGLGGEALPVQLGGVPFAVDREPLVEALAAPHVRAREGEGRHGGQQRIRFWRDGSVQVHGLNYASLSARCTCERACSIASSSSAKTCAECWSSARTPAASTTRRCRVGSPLS